MNRCVFQIVSNPAPAPFVHITLAFVSFPPIPPTIPEYRMTPVDFVLDVLLFDRTRCIRADDIRCYSLPLREPAYCSDWTGFLRVVLSPALFSHGCADLRSLLSDQLEASIGLYGGDSSVFASFGARAGFHRLQLDGHRALRAVIRSPLALFPPCAVSWDGFLCLLGGAMDMASHLWQVMDGGGFDPAQVDHYANLLVVVCNAARHITRVLCFQEGAGLRGERWPMLVSAESELFSAIAMQGCCPDEPMAPEPGPEPIVVDSFRIPAADSLRYTPTSLLPFGYDNVSFGALHGQQAPEGPCRAPVAASLFKHGAGGAGATTDGDYGDAVSALDGSILPPVWDHSLFLPSPPYPVPGRVRRAWGDAEDRSMGGAGSDAAVGGGPVAPGCGAGEGQGRFGAGAGACDAAHAFRGGSIGWNGVETGGGVFAVGGGAPVGVGPPGVAAPPPCGERGQCSPRWASVVQRGIGGGGGGGGGSQADAWPPLGSSDGGSRRRQRGDDGDGGGASRRARF